MTTGEPTKRASQHWQAAMLGVYNSCSSTIASSDNPCAKKLRVEMPDSERKHCGDARGSDDVVLMMDPFK